MPSKYVELIERFKKTGHRLIGHLTIWHGPTAAKQNGIPFYEVNCSCGGDAATFLVRADNLWNRVRSCGCGHGRPAYSEEHYYDYDIGPEDPPQENEPESPEDFGYVRYTRRIPLKPTLHPGAEVGRFTLVKRVVTSDCRAAWWVRCRCGHQKIVRADKLKAGVAVSCECDKPAQLTEEQLAVKRIWTRIRQRCTDPKDKDFERYAQLGIATVFYNSFDSFWTELGPRPTKRHSVDRIDNGRGYVPGNIRWATPKQQAKNRQPMQEK